MRPQVLKKKVPHNSHVVIPDSGKRKTESDQSDIVRNDSSFEELNF